MTDQINKMTERMEESFEKARAEGKEFHIPQGTEARGKKGYSLEEFNRLMEELDAPDGHIKLAEGMYYHTLNITSVIQKMSLHILEAPGALFFVTTDTPLVLYRLSSGSPTGAGWGNQDAMAVIPINPKYCLVLVYRKKATIYTKTLAPNEVHFWNINLIKYASHEVYSKHRYDIARDWMQGRGMWSEK